MRGLPERTLGGPPKWRRPARRAVPLGETCPVPIPYAVPPTAEVADPPRMVRPAHGRVLAGVCAGLAEHLGLPVAWVRGFVAVLILAGPGVVGYILLWALTPQEADSGAATAGQRWSLRQAGPAAMWIGIAMVAVVGATSVLPRSGGGLGILTPILILAIIAVIGLASADVAQRDRWLGRRSGWPALARLAGGLIAVVVGTVVMLSGGTSAAEAWDIVLATVVVLLGFTLLLAPWVLRLLHDVGEARTARALADERADIAAHLHDSVLQTLALIQRQAGDATRVATLARVQERELRTYLYGGGSVDQTTLSGALAEVIDEVEVAHGIPIDVVVTGDCPLDEHVQAMVRALREALLNAANHGAAPIAAYVECGPDRIEAFVRDHGPGLNLDAIPEDRLGVRESIQGRMTRVGGNAKVRRLEPGTEWTLTLPRVAAAPTGGN